MSLVLCLLLCKGKCSERRNTSYMGIEPTAFGGQVKNETNWTKRITGWWELLGKHGHRIERTKDRIKKLP